MFLFFLIRILFCPRGPTRPLGKLLSWLETNKARFWLQFGEQALPKQNKTPFNFFSIDARVRAKQANPGLSQTEITKKGGGRSWPHGALWRGKKPSILYTI
jgi:hypothetical protein